MEKKINDIIKDMTDCLNASQSKRLREVLQERLINHETQPEEISNEEYLQRFLNAKHIEGCSERTLIYYKATVTAMLQFVSMPIGKITTQLIRDYLTAHQKRNNCGKVTLDNVRRNLSSFFAWLEEENYISKNPLRRIHKVKTGTVWKDILSDEMIEILRDNTECIRDLAIIDLLLSTGIRVGELVNIDIADLNFEDRECIVYGKGSKERRVYFDARTKLHLAQYLQTRTDEQEALFVTLNRPYTRLKISGVEIRLRRLGRRLSIPSVYPHKFRRTMATRAIDKGMPVEQVQKLLGHQQIGTTMEYAMVNQSNVKNSHRKYIA